MSLTFISAVFADADDASAVVETQEAGAVLLSVADTPEQWEEMLAAVTPAPFVAPSPPPRAIAKTTIYRRATDAELALLEATVAALPLRDRLLWQDAEGGTVYVADVEPFFVQAVGAPRAAALLAP